MSKGRRDILIFCDYSSKKVASLFQEKEDLFYFGFSFYEVSNEDNDNSSCIILQRSVFLCHQV